MTSERKPYTLAEAATLAIEVQDACNLSRVLASFQFIVSDTIWPEARKLGKGTDYVNRHPIVSLFLFKLCDLNGISTFTFHYTGILVACSEISRTGITQEVTR